MTAEIDDFMAEQVATLEAALAARTEQYQQALQTTQKLEQIVSNGARLATHIAYLCSTLPERSTDIESASDQLRILLTSRQ